MNLRTALALFACTGIGSFSASTALAETSCCDRAAEAGEACKHPCCVDATALRTICFKCNPDKAKSCCDKAAAQKKECSHPCCIEAQKVGILCPKCNRGRPIALFNGKSLESWTALKGSGNENKWTVGEPGLAPGNEADLAVKKGGRAMVNDLDKVTGQDIHSKAEFGDALIEVDVMVPKGSNSGIYVMGRYEIQVLDSHGKDPEKLGMGDMGAVYGAAKPPINASKAPGEWQSYVIDFRAPRFDKDGKKVENARLVSVTLNGKLLHKDLELSKQTPGGVQDDEAPAGPLMFQGNHGEVAYRNIFITPRDGK